MEVHADTMYGVRNVDRKKKEKRKEIYFILCVLAEYPKN